jgi:mannose-6-phosphate isomerase
MLYPLIFHPIFKERIWGGRYLDVLYGKSLPPGVPIGESWEISDRPGDSSVIANGPLAGRDLRWVMQNHQSELLGAAPSLAGRFPLLVKILDARDRLSLQVHPPQSKAAKLGGDPKTEMWYIADAMPGAELYVGLKSKTTRQEFEKKLGTGAVAECFHKVPVQAGDAMFLPSGRVHAIGAGLVIFEIQENSDTTYRVFDWNRVGLDGKPRDLHVAQSLASIDFEDFEPSLADRASAVSGGLSRRSLVDSPLFRVEALLAHAPQAISLHPQRMRILGVVEGQLTVEGNFDPVEVRKGQFCLVPAEIAARVHTGPECSFLLVQTGG